MRILLHIVVTFEIVCLTVACKPTPDANHVAAEINIDTTYSEPHRPQFHFSPPAHWMNDPNGMVYFEGEYHLFYQYFPDSTVWGPMHWGHAISTDLVHWEHLPIALYPDSLGYIFSGSAVIDWNNTSGFGQDGKPPMVAIYTYHDPAGDKAGRTDYQSQAIAYSNDRGRTWTKYGANPVIPNTGKLRDFRDPKVFWHEPSAQWIMALAILDHIALWASSDLKHWSHLSDWGKAYGAHEGVWECPDLFPMVVAETGETKWVLLQNLNPGAPNGGSGTQYFVGDFDGKTFKLDKAFEKNVVDGHAMWLDHGRDNYAGVTWSDIPKEDGRRLFMGWMGNWEYAQVVPTQTWRSAMTIPCELQLKNTHDGYRLYSVPARELKALRTSTKKIEPADINQQLDITDALGCAPSQMEMEIGVQWDETASADFGIQLSNTKGEIFRIGYDTEEREFYCDRTKSGDHSFSDKYAARIYSAAYDPGTSAMKLRVYFDIASSELFVDDGAFVMTDIFFPSEDFTRLSLYASKGKVRITGGEAFAIDRIWP